MNELTLQMPQMAIARELFEQYPFATLLLQPGNSGAATQICHLPFLYDPNGHCFIAHASANNPIIALINQGQCQATVIFTGEHGYVSPTWTKHQRVPTWDYCVVHVGGEIALVEAPDEKYQSMVSQVAAMEGHSAQDWQLESLDQSLQQHMLSAIRVIKIPVDNMHYRYKMSQNKHPDGKAAILANFTATDKEALVRRYRQLF